MIYPVFAYRDNKTSFMSPFVDQSEQAAIRGFSFAIKNQPGIMQFAPADFDLFKIGTFDSVSGVITPICPIEFVVNGNAVGEPHA